MGEFAMTLMIFVAVISITAVLFSGWVIFRLVRGVLRVIVWLIRLALRPAPPVFASDAIQCVGERCRAENSAKARFCRRCGGRLPQVQAVQVRRAAVL